MMTRNRSSLFGLALIASALLAVAPAAVAAGAPPQPPAAVQLPAAGCGQSQLFPALRLPSPAAQTASLAGPACTLRSEDTASHSRPFRGFCACSCTFTPDCNTSADCGGSACLPAVTCCAVGH
jgi:hypothetical protein